MPTILIVEDDALQRMHSTALVEDAGHEAIEAANADEAILILEQRSDICCVVTDVTMPGKMDGVRLANYISGRWQPVHLIVVSGLPLPGALPATALFFRKPVADQQLLSALARLSPPRQIPGR